MSSNMAVKSTYKGKEPSENNANYKHLLNDSICGDAT